MVRAFCTQRARGATKDYPCPRKHRQLHGLQAEASRTVPWRGPSGRGLSVPCSLDVFTLHDCRETSLIEAHLNGTLEFDAIGAANHPAVGCQAHCVSPLEHSKRAQSIELMRNPRKAFMAASDAELHCCFDAMP